MGYRRSCYRRGFGNSQDYNLGYGAGFGRDYASYGDHTKCVRFPDLPRGWWANPAYEGTPVPHVPSVGSEREYLEVSMKGLEQELADIKKRLAELSTSEK